MNESLVQEEGIPFNPSLPCIEAEEETALRSPDEVGVCMTCLFCVTGTAFHPEDSRFKQYLRQHSLWGHLTPDEESFLSADTPEPRSVVNFTWRCEALFVLMWSAEMFDVLPIPRQETDPTEIVMRFPTLDREPSEFIQRVRLRHIPEILDASDLIYRTHWAVRQAQLEGKDAPSGLRSGVVQEWHHAINWITRYNDQDWDDVSTDT